MENNIKLSATNEKCKNCGGDLIFNPKTRKLDCEKCQSQFDFEMIKLTDKHPYVKGIPNQDTLTWAHQKKIVKCQTCGADIELYGLQFTQKCPYCDSNYVTNEDDLPGLKIDAVIPFQFGEDDALIKFQEGIKKKFFVPSAFKKKLPKNQILGIYVPTFNFDMDTFTAYTGVLEKNVTVKRGKNTYIEKRRFNISGTQSMVHRNYVVESSDNLNDKQITSLLPYDFDESYAYKADFVRGHVAKHYEDDLDKCHDVAKEKIDDAIKNYILRKYTYDNVVSFHANTTYSNEAYIYRLLPLYNFVFDYKNKKYTVVMNGQTGKVGKGLPVSGLKVTIVVFIALIIIIGIFLLAYYNG